jgi:hypothetical protein
MMIGPEQEASMSERARVIEERHGFPGALRARGGVGGHIGVRHCGR